MILTLFIQYITASGSPPNFGQCEALPVARDQLLTRGECANRFAGGFLQLGDRRFKLVAASSRAPESDLALFTLEANLPRSVPVAKIGPCDLAANPPLEYFQSAEPSDFVLDGRRLVGVLQSSGEYLKVASVCGWLRLKLGGD